MYQVLDGVGDFCQSFILLLAKLTISNTCFGTIFTEFSCSEFLGNDVKESQLFWFWLSLLTDLPGGLDWDLFLAGIIPHTDSKWCSLPHLLQDLPCAGHSFNWSACLFLPQPMHLLPGRNSLGFNRDCPPVWLQPWFHVPFLDHDCEHPLWFWLLALELLLCVCPEPFFLLEWCHLR